MQKIKEKEMSFNPMTDNEFTPSNGEINRLRMRVNNDITSAVFRSKTIVQLENHYDYKEGLEYQSLSKTTIKIYRFTPKIESNFLPIVSADTFYQASKMALSAMYRFEMYEGQTIKELQNKQL
ncbi:MAG: hypothetical protein KDD32_09280 [Bacteroidetes bacterium]|nr:hypothetical protein [Bacteroidota bacterium]